MSEKWMKIKDELFERWVSLESGKWRKFKAERLKTWLEPVKLPPSEYEEADERYSKFMQQKLLEVEERKKAGKPVKSWETAEDPERKAGWRGQKWFSIMLRHLRVSHDSELSFKSSFENRWLEIKDKIGFDFKDWLALKHKWEINPDISIKDFGTIEIKTMKPKAEDFKIKKVAWDHNPSLYLIVLRTCDESMLEFQFIGWLHGHEVYGLKVQPKHWVLYPKTHYYGEAKDLRSPKNFLQRLLNVSRANPSRLQREE